MLHQCWAIMKRLLLLAGAIAWLGALQPLCAQAEQQRLDKIERQLTDLNSQVKDAGDAGLILFLFGGFCALWAQNTGRNAWLWFFLGLFFSVFTVIALLIKNAHARKSPKPQLFSEGRQAGDA